MTKDEIRIAVAQAMGFKREQKFGGSGARLVWWVKEGREYSLSQLPNFPEDLNACHEMEKTLSVSEAFCYRDLLFKLVNPSEAAVTYVGMFTFAATALQRCEAFLKVKGLWK